MEKNPIISILELKGGKSILNQQTQIASEVQQLSDLINSAANSSPALWQNILIMVNITEFTYFSVLENKREGVEISSETNTSTVFKVRELK
ncbi:MAG: hypothetical protein JW715_06155 [Sedimentisphaerales bacterium]|nr:hypothetical protein [Sedimentisphaerales bacterium]